MNVLVLNCGSSSLKYQLIDMNTRSVLAKGICEKIGIDGSSLTHKPTGKEQLVVNQPMPDHKAAVKLVMDALLDKKYGVVKSMNEIQAVAMCDNQQNGFSHGEHHKRYDVNLENEDNHNGESEAAEH